MSTTTEQIKERLSIVDVVGSYIAVERSGTNFKAKCPFHNEKTASFFISPERNSYYCFGCNVKGDIFSFVQEFESLDFAGALKVLAERAGVPLSDVANRDSLKEKNENDILFKAMEEATIFFQKNLASSNDSLVYLKKRGLKIEMVRDWKIGLAPSDWRVLKSHLLGKGYFEKDILKAGLIKQGDQGSYDRFRGRIMFPIFDTSGRTIAFSGRILKDTEHEPKYLNSPETPLFTKSKVLYGLHKAKSAIREKGYAVLVEGQMDLLMSHQALFANTVASSGTALTSEHVDLIKRLTDSLVIAYDSDSAGQNASFKAWQLALGSGLQIKVALLPSGYDPAQAVLENPSLWKDAVEQAKHIVDYYISIIKGLGQKDADSVIKEKILPLIRALESSIDQSRFVQKLSFETGIAENAIWEELSKINVDKAETKPEEKKQSHKSDYILKALTFFVFLEKKDQAKALAFKEKVCAIAKEKENYFSISSDEKAKLSFEGEVYYGNSPNDVAEEEILYNLEEDVLKEKFADAMYKLRKAETEKNVERIEELAMIVHNVSKKLSELSKRHFNN